MPLSEELEFNCPYCASSNSISIDFSAGRRQRLITDCETCCAPIVINLVLDGQTIASFDAHRENE